MINKYEQDYIYYDNAKHEKVIGYNFIFERKLTDLKFTDTTEYIDTSAFENNCYIEKLTMPKNLKIIHDYAFNNTSLKEIKANKKLQIIGSHAFEGCDFDKFEMPESLEYIGDFAFHAVNFNGDLILPENIGYIGERAFSDAKMSSITLKPNRLIDLKEAVFENVSARKIELENIANIDHFAFANTAIEVLSLPNTLKTISPNVFGIAGPFGSFLKKVIIPFSKEKFLENDNAEGWNKDFLKDYEKIIEFKTIKNLDELLSEGKSVSEINQYLKIQEER